MAPLSRFASSLKPNVAYLALNFAALWKKQTTLPSLAYAGIPYQVFGERAGALVVTIAWIRLAMARSGPGISAIFASTALSPAALSLSARASALSSWARSFIAARSSSENPLDVLSLPVCPPFFVVFLSAMRSTSWSNESPAAHLRCDRPPRRAIESRARSCHVSPGSRRPTDSGRVHGSPSLVTQARGRRL